jgi:methionyl-tRNA formyltransferase
VGEGQGEGKKAPGTIVIADKNLAVATGKGTLYLTDVQLEGKKRMPIEAFLRGHKIKVGETFK